MGSMAQNIKIVRRNGEALPETAIKELKAAVKGEVLFKGEAEEEVYRAAIDRFNKGGIQEAAIIVFCETEDDVAAALKYAQEWDFEVVISAGRHSFYGASSTKGLVVDLRRMRSVVIDKENMKITAGGGCKAVDLETPLQAEGYYAVFGAANDTGIGGITLGGGSGLLTGQYGLVCDNLIAARVVLADGRVLEASETTNADLFWGIRGGGSNFGVVTEFTYRIHKQRGDIFFGPLVFVPDQTKQFLEAADSIKEAVDANDGKLAVFLAFMKPPGSPKPTPLALIFYDGPAEKAKELVKPLYGLSPVADMTAVVPYATITAPNPLVDGPPTHQRYATSNFQMFFPLDVDMWLNLVDDYGAFMTKYGDAVAPSKIVMEIRSYAKSSSLPVSAMAYALRRPAVMSALEAQYDASVDDAVMRQDVKTISDKVRDVIRKKGLYPEGTAVFNANISTGSEKITDMFGENLPKLRELKKKYDPKFVFNKWYPIAPAA